MLTKLITSQDEVLLLLADESLRLSVWEGKARIVRRDTVNTLVARVQYGLPTKMRDNDLVLYNGGYELTEKGKARAAKLKSEQDSSSDVLNNPSR